MSLVHAEKLALPGRLGVTDLALAAGSVTCLVGPNGSGKTSLLHALARIGEASGSVTVSGIAIDGLSPARRAKLLAYLPASRDLAWPIAARDLIALSGADAAAIDGIMDMLALRPFADRRTDRLSTGERSRVLIARAMATAPRLLLLDEPTANLDPFWQIRLMEMLRSDVAARGQAAVVAMHDLDAAGRYADRLIVMSGGEIAADGLPHVVIASPTIQTVFGIERSAGEWRPTSLNVAADRQSSP